MKLKTRNHKQYLRFERLDVSKIHNAVPKRTDRAFKFRGHPIVVSK